MENIIYSIVAAAFYWTFMVATIAVLSHRVDNTRDVMLVVGIAVTWPLFAIVALVALPYGAAVASTKRIRIDLHNRKLLREFETWIRERDNGTVCKKQ